MARGPRELSHQRAHLTRPSEFDLETWIAVYKGPTNSQNVTRSTESTPGEASHNGRLKERFRPCVMLKAAAL